MVSFILARKGNTSIEYSISTQWWLHLSLLCSYFVSKKGQGRVDIRKSLFVSSDFASGLERGINGISDKYIDNYSFKTIDTFKTS